MDTKDNAAIDRWIERHSKVPITLDDLPKVSEEIRLSSCCLGEYTVHVSNLHTFGTGHVTCHGGDTHHLRMSVKQYQLLAAAVQLDKKVGSRGTQWHAPETHHVLCVDVILSHALQALLWIDMGWTRAPFLGQEFHEEVTCR